MGLCWWFPDRGRELSGAGCGLVGRGWSGRSPGLGGIEERLRGGADIFRPLPGSVLSMSRSAAAAAVASAIRLVPLVAESLVTGQKPQPLSHMF